MAVYVLHSIPYVRFLYVYIHRHLCHTFVYSQISPLSPMSPILPSLFISLSLSLFLSLSLQLFREMTKVMRECWYYTSTARPTAVYLKKKLLKMSQELEKMNYREIDLQEPT